MSIFYFLNGNQITEGKNGTYTYKLGFLNLFVVDSVGKSRGLALLWGEDVVIDIQNYSHRHINDIVKTMDTSFC